MSKGYYRTSGMGEEIWESCTEEVPAFQVTVLLNCWTVDSLTCTALIQMRKHAHNAL